MIFSSPAESCSKCKYYSGSDQKGSCERFPPTVLFNPSGGDYSKFPEVKAEQYCGEFKKK